MKQAIFEDFPNLVVLDVDVLAAIMVTEATGKFNCSLVIRKESDSWGIAADRCEALRQEYGLFRRVAFSNVL